MKIDLAVLPGDGVGPEVTAEANKVLMKAADLFGHDLSIEELPVGWAAVNTHGDPLPEETLSVCLQSNAVFLGAVGSPEADAVEVRMRPEQGLLRLRKELDCFANLRPARVTTQLADMSPLRPEIVSGTDLIVVRELSSGIYYGDGGRDDLEGRAWNTMSYNTPEISRIAEVAFNMARQRGNRVVSVDKANVLAVSRLWREVVDAVGHDYDDVELTHMLVDRAAMELVFNPAQFDVILTANMFGDILSDQAASVTGSIGTLESASVGGRVDLYEPVHGSAPGIAGRNKANPLGAINSVAMMLRHTFGLESEANLVDDAVKLALSRGNRTADIAGSQKPVGTSVLGDAVVEAVYECAAEGIGIVGDAEGAS